LKQTLICQRARNATGKQPVEIRSMQESVLSAKKKKNENGMRLQRVALERQKGPLKSKRILSIY
jgi:hypothetical protein